MLLTVTQTNKQGETINFVGKGDKTKGLTWRSCGLGTILSFPLLLFSQLVAHSIPVHTNKHSSYLTISIITLRKP